MDSILFLHNYLHWIISLDILWRFQENGDRNRCFFIYPPKNFICRGIKTTNPYINTKSLINRCRGVNAKKGCLFVFLFIYAYRTISRSTLNVWTISVAICIDYNFIYSIQCFLCMTVTHLTCSPRDKLIPWCQQTQKGEE